MRADPAGARRLPTVSSPQVPTSSPADTPPGGELLEFRDVTKTFGPVVALDRVSFDVVGGTIHGVVGQNGAGKSTLMRILAGAFREDGGTVRLDGAELQLRSPDHARRLGIRIIHQELTLVPMLSVAENISLGIEPRTARRTLDRRAMRRRARELLALLGHGEEFSVDRKTETLNIGQQQIVEIAKALAWEANILILDEPTAALELQDTERLFDVLRRFREQNGTALYVSHRLDELFEICDRVTVLRDGRLVGTNSIAETDKGQIIQMMIGQPLTEMFPDRVSDGDPAAVLEVTDLNAPGLHLVSFVARAGRILGIVGLEGSGIRDVGKVLIGDRPVSSGQIAINGADRALVSPRAARSAGIVYLSADRKAEGLFSILPLAQNVAIGTLADRLQGILIDRGAERRLVAASIDQLRIQTSGPRQEVQYLSGGNQQKVLMARSLAARPVVFVLEEPTRGIDIGAKAEIYALVRELANQGAAVVVISNDMPEVIGLADEIVAMFEGAVSATLPGGTTEEEVLSHIA